MKKRQLICFLSVLCSFSFAVKFQMKDLAQRNLVLINSEAVLERTVAVSHFVSGWIEVSPENLSKLNGEFEIDLRTLDTGLELKNIQLREQLLNSKEFPIGKAFCEASLDGQKLKLIDKKTVEFPTECRIKIKNIEKKVPVKIKLTYFKENDESRQRLTGNLLKFSAACEIDLASFDINIPSNYTGLIAKSVQVGVDMVGTDKLPNNALSLPEGLKTK